MLSNKLRVAATFLLLTTVGVVNAGAFEETHAYFGGEVSIFNRTSYNGGNTPDLNNFKTNDGASTLVIRKNKVGVNFFAGMRFTENVGAEIGFGFITTASATAQNNRQATNKVSNVYLDVLGYLPVSPCVELIGSAGIGGLQSRPDVDGVTFQDKDRLTKTKVGFRIGGGAQMSFTENWAARALLRYEKGNKNFLKSNVSFSIGGLYTFT